MTVSRDCLQRKEVIAHVKQTSSRCWQLSRGSMGTDELATQPLCHNCSICKFEEHSNFHILQSYRKMSHNRNLIQHIMELSFFNYVHLFSYIFINLCFLCRYKVYLYIERSPIVNKLFSTAVIPRK